MNRKRCLTATCLVVSILLSAQNLAGQEEPTESSEGFFTEFVDVNLVNVEVHITDKKHQPVLGLTASDFEAFEDGRLVEISNFVSVENRSRLSADRGDLIAPGNQVASEEEQLAGRQATVAAKRQPLHLIVYFDNLFLRPFNRTKVGRALETFLAANLAGDDRVMLVTFERSMHIRQPFTTEVRKVLDELQNVERLTGFAVQTSSARSRAIQRIEQSRSIQEALQHADTHARQVEDELLASIRQLKDLTSSIAGLPGRKAILYVSDGVPMTPAEDLFYLVDQQFSGEIVGQLRANQYGAAKKFSELTALANTSGVTFHTLDAGGARTHTSLSAETGGSTGGALRSSSNLEIDFARFANIQAPLLAMAADTGGLATVNSNNIRGALSRIADDLNSYYLLGYHSATSGDGRYHRIKIRVKNCNDCTVRYRQGYRDRSAVDRIQDSTRATLLYGSEANPLDVQLTIGQIKPYEAEFLATIEIHIPFASLTLVPRENLYHGSLQVSVGVADPKGGLSRTDVTPVPIEVPSEAIEEALQNSFVYTADLLMRQGTHRVAVGVRDDLGGKSSFIGGLVDVQP